MFMNSNCTLMNHNFLNHPFLYLCFIVDLNHVKSLLTEKVLLQFTLNESATHSLDY